MKLKTAYMGVFLAFALILSYVESLIPFYFGIPGVKLGLANLAIVLALYYYGVREALLLNVLRVFLSGFLFGNLFIILYSLAGALTSFLVMVLLKRIRGFGITGVSIGGGISHNLGQLAVAVFVTRTAGVYYYLPVLLIAGALTGFAVGIAAMKVNTHLERSKKII